ncbi:MAG: hypothetical protein EOO70_04025 [Myxococcaceae bacterium]|nr:MAG: hypothetical protein EOO70_04025 [Myxococcaceae bacterium]
MNQAKPLLHLTAVALLLAGCSEPNLPPVAGVDAQPAVAAPQVAATQGEPAVLEEATQPIPSRASLACNLESVRRVAEPAGKPFEAGEGEVVRFDGWMLAGDGLGAPGSVRVRFVDEAGHAWTAPLALTMPRADVPRADSGGAVGYAQAVSLKGLAAGRYHLLLEAETGGQQVHCDNGRVLQVGSP